MKIKKRKTRTSILLHYHVPNHPKRYAKNQEKILMVIEGTQLGKQKEYGKCTDVHMDEQTGLNSYTHQKQPSRGVLIKSCLQEFAKQLY